MKGKLRRFSLLFLELTVLFLPAALFAADQVRYLVSLADPENHLVRVTIEIPPGESQRELQLPVWNALYQVRDFSQYMNWIRAESITGVPLQLEQINTSRWKLSGAERGAWVHYEMFSDDPGPYGAQLNLHHAFFNLAEILCYAKDQRNRPTEVEFRDLPAKWRIATALDQQGSVFSANNYDQLVDSPVEIGTFAERDVHGPSEDYRIVVDADDQQSILDKISPAVLRIAGTEVSWMNDRPFQTYLFIFHFSDAPGDGGMEHAYSTAITLPKRELADDFDLFTNVTAHEFFHLWNVKRIRPQSLEPVDYTKANYTTALWFSEGVDSTVAGYIQLRAGLIDEKRYLAYLGEQITELESRPAHLAQSAEQSSIDAWLEKYAYYNLPERSISYYNKGELLGVLLDLKMRELTDDKVSLRDLFQWMNENYAKQGKFFPDSAGVRHAAETLTHSSLEDFFQKYVSGVEQIPWDAFFNSVGLHVTATNVIFADAGFEAERHFDQPPTVVQVEPRSGADQAGLQAGDVILQINGKTAGRAFQKQIAQLAPGSSIKIGISRDGAQRQLEWKLGSRTQTLYRLEELPNVSADQKTRRAAWLFDGARAAAASGQ